MFFRSLLFTILTLGFQSFVFADCVEDSMKIHGLDRNQAAVLCQEFLENNYNDPMEAVRNMDLQQNNQNVLGNQGSIQCNSNEFIAYVGNGPGCVVSKVKGGGYQVRTPDAPGGMTVDNNVVHLHNQNANLPVFDPQTGKYVTNQQTHQESINGLDQSAGQTQQALNACSSQIRSGSAEVDSCFQELCKGSTDCLTSAKAEACAQNPKIPGCPQQNSFPGDDDESMEVTRENSENLKNYADAGQDQNVDSCLMAEEAASKWCSDQNSMYNLMAQQMLAAFKQPDGIKEGCNLQQKLSNMGTAGEGFMATRCHSYHNKCQQICGSTGTQLESKKSILESNIAQAKANKDRENAEIFKRQLTSTQAKISTVKAKYGRCSNLKDSVFNKGQNAFLMQAQAYGARKCSKEIDAADAMAKGFGDINNQEIFAGDCTSSANASNPLCIRCNNDPKASGCEGIKTMAAGSNNEDDPFGNDADSFGDVEGYGNAAYGTDSGDVELDTPESVKANSKGSRTIASGSGGGPNGSGGFGEGGLSSPEGPKDPNQKLNTDLVGGEKGGSGYSVSTAGGGGYSSSSGGTSFKFEDERGPNPFDLKAFLPGAKKKEPLPLNIFGFGKLRGLASLSAKNDLLSSLNWQIDSGCKKGSYNYCPKSKTDYFKDFKVAKNQKLHPNFQNRSVMFRLPNGWMCIKDRTAWECRSTEKFKQKDASIVVMTKLHDSSTDPPYWASLLSKPIKRQYNDKKLSKVGHSKVVNGKVTKSDSLHIGSAIKGFNTRYILVLHEKVAIGIALTADTKRYPAYAKVFNDLVRSIKVAPEKSWFNEQIGLAKNDPTHPIGQGFAGTTALESTESSLSEGILKYGLTKKKLIAILLILTGVAATILTLLLSRKKEDDDEQIQKPREESISSTG